MPSKWRLRVGLDDRPGSIAAVTAALAANGIDILRLDVVSRDDMAVDDIWVAVPSKVSPSRLHELDRVPGVLFLNVSPAYDEEDPVGVMALACAALTRAGTLDAIRAEGVNGARSVGHARLSLLIAPVGGGQLRVTASSGPAFGDVRPEEPCLARPAAELRKALVARGADAWGPSGWRLAIPAGWVAAVPLLVAGDRCFSSLLVIREEDTAFQPGELTRLTQYGQVLAGVLRAHGDTPANTPAAEWARPAMPVP